MIKILESLKSIGDELEQKGLNGPARVVTGAMETMYQVKTAQYEGGQGYWIRNRRCWDNCYRQKRVANPSQAAQEVWFDCWDEYLKSINDNNSGWEKYAGSNVAVKTAYGSAKESKYFNETVQKKIKDGQNIPSAVYETIEASATRQAEQTVDEINNLLRVAEYLEKLGNKDTSQKIYDACFDIIKEAQFWSGVKQKAKDVGGWLGQKAKDVGTALRGTPLGTLQKQLQTLLQEVTDIRNRILNSKNMRPQQQPVALSENRIVQGIIRNDVPPAQQNLYLQQNTPRTPVLAPLIRTFMDKVYSIVNEFSRLAGEAGQKKDFETQSLAQAAAQSLNSFYPQMQQAVANEDFAAAEGAISSFVNSINNVVAGVETEVQSQTQDQNQNNVPDSQEAGAAQEQDQNQNNVPDSQEAGAAQTGSNLDDAMKQAVQSVRQNASTEGEAYDGLLRQVASIFRGMLAQPAPPAVWNASF